MHLLKDNEKKENPVLSFFKNISNEIVKHPHSAIRGVALATTVISSQLAMSYDPIKPIYDIVSSPYAAAFCGLAAMYASYTTHALKENLYKLEKEAYPKKRSNNIINTVKEYAFTASYVLLATMGLSTALDTNLPDKDFAVKLTAMAGMAAVTASILESSFLRDRRKEKTNKAEEEITWKKENPNVIRLSQPGSQQPAAPVP